MIILDILFWLMLLILFTSMFVYPILISILGKNKRNKQCPAQGISVIVPVHNEERYIGRKIENLLSCDHEMKIFVVDNGSTDKTAGIAEEYSVTLLKSGRGKVAAINEGIKNAQTDMIVVTDADTTSNEGSIRSLVGYLQGDVGAVCGYPMLKTSGQGLFYLRSKLKYYTADWKQRYTEGLVDSACSLDGKLMAFRKSIVGEFPPDLLSDDYALTLMTRKKGYRCIVDENAIVYEEVPKDFKEEIKQIRRRLSIGLYSTIVFRGMLFNPKYGEFGTLIFPFRRFFPLFAPWLLIYICAYLLFASFKVALVAIIVGVLAILMIKGPYFFMQLIGLCLAWYDFLMGRAKSHDIWRKIHSNYSQC